MDQPETIDPATLVTNEDIQTRRSCAEFIQWVDRVLDQCRVTKEVRDFMRMRRTPAVKAFYDEVLPFRVYAGAELAQKAVDIWIPNDDGPYDAHVFGLQGPDSDQPFQIVTATDGYREALRREKICTDKSSPALGQIKRTKEGIEAKSIALSPHMSIDSVCDQICAAIQNKKRKSYPEGTWLLVGFSEELLLQDGYDLVVETATRAAEDAAFDAVYLVGSRPHAPFCRKVR